MGKPPRMAKGQLGALDRLSKVSGIERFYLGGGAGIGFHLGHRRSEDLDLFTDDRCTSPERFAESIRAALPDVDVVDASDVTVKVRVAGVPVDLVRYPYPPLSTPKRGPSGVRVAGLRDLAAMKLAAIVRRGLRRDFWDLYAIAQSGVSLRDAASAYLDRFGLAQPDLYAVCRALAYFVDAEKDPALPAGLTMRRWEAVKRWFRREAPGLLALDHDAASPPRRRSHRRRR